MVDIKIGNINIHYIVKGRGQPLIFLHGIFFDSSGYKELVNILSNHFQVYALDMPNHGKSGNYYKQFSENDYVETIGQFVKNLGITNPIICGHSAGGLIALIYASIYKINKLILINSGGVKFSGSLANFLFKTVVIKTVNGLFLNPLKELQLLIIGSKNISRTMFNKNYWKLLINSLNKNYFATMQKIKYPTTIIWAKNDELLPYKNSALFKKHISNSKLITVEGNHDWPILRPEIISDLFKQNLI